MFNKIKLFIYFSIFVLILTNLLLLSQFFWNQKENLSIDVLAEAFVEVSDQNKTQNPQKKQNSIPVLNLSKISEKPSNQKTILDFSKINESIVAENKVEEVQEPSPKAPEPTPPSTPEEPKAPEPNPVEYIGSKHEYEDKIRARCNSLGCDTIQVIKTMYCESNGNPNAQSPKGTYKGLFQYSQSTFNSFSVSSGLSGADIWNADHQIHTTTWAFANGKESHWPHCSKI